MLAADDSPRILVVDDEKVIREVLADFLSLENFHVQTAEDGEQALVALDRETYDLVLSDLKMPKIGGLELLEQIQSRWAATTKAVIMTGFGTVETAIDAMKRGAHDYILKPFKVDEVVLTVRRAIEEQRLEAENLRLKQAVSLYEAGEKIAATLSIDDVLDTVKSAALEGTRAAEVDLVLDGEIGEDAAVDAERLMDHFRDGGGPLRVHGEEASPFGLGVAPSALLAVPLEHSGRLLGVMALSSFEPGRRFDEGQRKLASMLGHRAAASIENAKLYGDLQRTIQETIRGLARAIDKLDPYTAGHSDRVAIYAGLLAEEMGLPAPEVEVIRRSAQMHDIGKIGCHLNLNKPGKLTAAEYEEFKKHPTFGREILEPISFLRPLIPGVHLHHERMDGAGYPLGIPGEDIPRMARIICIADSYDAMTSDRAYRSAMKHSVAVAELRRCAGTQFDADLVPLFVKAIEQWRDEREDRGWPVSG